MKGGSPADSFTSFTLSIKAALCHGEYSDESYVSHIGEQMVLNSPLQSFCSGLHYDSRFFSAMFARGFQNPGAVRMGWNQSTRHFRGSAFALFYFTALLGTNAVFLWGSSLSLAYKGADLWKLWKKLSRWRHHRTGNWARGSPFSSLLRPSREKAFIS